VRDCSYSGCYVAVVNDPVILCVCKVNNLSAFGTPIRHWCHAVGFARVAVLDFAGLVVEHCQLRLVGIDHSHAPETMFWDHVAPFGAVKDLGSGSGSNSGGLMRFFKYSFS